jgi:hypothetical protein
MRGGKRTVDERKNAKCFDKTDPITLDEIDPVYAIRIKENDFYYCFDIRSLSQYLNSQLSQGFKLLNPLTRKLFTESSISKINKKIDKLNLPQLEFYKYEYDLYNKIFQHYYKLINNHTLQWDDSDNLRMIRNIFVLAPNPVYKFFRLKGSTKLNSSPGMKPITQFNNQAYLDYSDDITELNRLLNEN